MTALAGTYADIYFRNGANSFGAKLNQCLQIDYFGALFVQRVTYTPSAGNLDITCRGPRFNVAAERGAWWRNACLVGAAAAGGYMLLDILMPESAAMIAATAAVGAGVYAGFTERGRQATRQAGAFLSGASIQVSVEAPRPVIDTDEFLSQTIPIILSELATVARKVGQWVDLRSINLKLEPDLSELTGARLFGLPITYAALQIAGETAGSTCRLILHLCVDGTKTRRVTLTFPIAATTSSMSPHDCTPTAQAENSTGAPPDPQAAIDNGTQAVRAILGALAGSAHGSAQLQRVERRLDPSVACVSVEPQLVSIARNRGNAPSRRLKIQAKGGGIAIRHKFIDTVFSTLGISKATQHVSQISSNLAARLLNEPALSRVRLGIGSALPHIGPRLQVTSCKIAAAEALQDMTSVWATIKVSPRKWLIPSALTRILAPAVPAPLSANLKGLEVVWKNNSVYLVTNLELCAAGISYTKSVEKDIGVLAALVGHTKPCLPPFLLSLLQGDDGRIFDAELDGVTLTID